ncbi:MAG: DUF3143 domain-containing protein [Oscillatoriales cyanobacterium SM2_1_8]|nr:DUF3143 domain-containing protein [Oscillatoriales cyanobacterium SM2_1_8]
MSLPSTDTALYNHPLAKIEEWLRGQDCRQSDEDPSLWYVERTSWRAELYLDVEDVRVRYLEAGGGTRDIHRAFPYSLTRQDIEDAIFTGP